MVKKKAKRKVGRPRKESPVETIKHVQFRLENDWISLVTDPSIAEKPDLSELHDICKFSLLLIEKLAGYSVDQILREIYKDIKANVKARHKFVLDSLPDQAIKDVFKVPVEKFKRYK